MIEGEVMFGGTYTLDRRNARLSDLFKKAGGSTDQAYIKGARLMRKANEAEKTRMEAGYIPDRLEEYLSKVTEGTCEICGYNYKKIWREDCEQNNHFVRFIPRRTDQKCKNGDNVWKHFHCICPSCSQLPYKAIGEKLGEKDFFDDELWIV